MTTGESVQQLNLDQATLLRLYRQMVTIRNFEEQVLDLYARTLIPGIVHVSIGQEAVAAGVCGLLRSDDFIITTHRGHGHSLAKGAQADKMLAELLGKVDGYCRGKGGSMHVADPSTAPLFRQILSDTTEISYLLVSIMALEKMKDVGSIPDLQTVAASTLPEMVREAAGKAIRSIQK